MILVIARASPAFRGKRFGFLRPKRRYVLPDNEETMARSTRSARKRINYSSS